MTIIKDIERLIWQIDNINECIIKDNFKILIRWGTIVAIHYTFRDKNDYYTTKKTQISEKNLEREKIKSIFNFITKFCDCEICEILFFSSVISLFNFVFPSSVTPISFT